MLQSNLFTLACFLVLPSSVFAQASFGASRLGVVFEELSKSVRPVVGYPGAAIVGEALLTNVENALPSPDGKWVLVDVEGAAGEASSRILRLNGDLLLTLPKRKHAIWSADSKSLAALVGDGAKLEWYAVSDSGEWMHKKSFSLGGDSAKLLALDGLRGQLWLRMGPENAAGTLSVLRINANSPELVHEVNNPVAFASSGRPGGDWLFAEGITGKIRRLRLESSGWQVSDVSLSHEEKGEVPFLHVFDDNSFLVIREQRLESVEQTLRTLLHYSAWGDLQKSVVLEAPADGFVPVSANKLIRLQNRIVGGAAIFLYDAEAKEAYFVPVPSLATAGREGLQ